MIRADYLVEGKQCLGVIAISCGSLAFLSLKDRCELMGSDAGLFTYLPKPLRLSEVFTTEDFLT